MDRERWIVGSEWWEVRGWKASGTCWANCCLSMPALSTDSMSLILMASTAVEGIRPHHRRAAARQQAGQHAWQHAWQHAMQFHQRGGRGIDAQESPRTVLHRQHTLVGHLPIDVGHANVVNADVSERLLEARGVLPLKCVVDLLVEQLGGFIVDVRVYEGGGV